MKCEFIIDVDPAYRVCRHCKLRIKSEHPPERCIAKCRKPRLRTDEQIKEILTVCETCEYVETSVILGPMCKVCPCYVQRKGLLVYLQDSKTTCPKGKW